MTHATEPRAARSSRNVILPVANYPCGDVPPGIFLGTAAEHLEAIERRIAEARAKHRPVADLLKRKTKLKARCAALGAK